MSAHDLRDVNERLSRKSSGVWNLYVGTSRLREAAAWALAIISAFTAFIGIGMANKYAGTIVHTTTIEQVDQFGQLIGVRGLAVRANPDVLATATTDNFIHDVFTILDSRSAMQRNAAEAQAMIGSPTARAVVLNYWQQTSPLHADGSWVAPLAETHVEMTSRVSRGPSNGGTEYSVEFAVQRIDTTGQLSPKRLYMADLVLAPGGTITDANVGGLQITHFSFSEVH